MRARWKLLIMTLIAIIVGQRCFLSEKRGNLISALPEYSFIDAGDIITAQGTWAANPAEGGLPVQAVQVECSRNKGECVEMYSSLLLGHLIIASCAICLCSQLVFFRLNAQNSSTI